MDGGADAEARLEIRHSENHLLFTVGSRQLIARLLDVNFPDYEKILSKCNDRVAQVPTAAAKDAIRRVSLFSSERSRGVKLSFEKDLLTVASASQELGEGTETLDVSFDGEPLSIGLNAQYLLDFLEEAETESCDSSSRTRTRSASASPKGGSRAPRGTSTSSCRCGSELSRGGIRPLAAFRDLEPGLPQPLLRPRVFRRGCHAHHGRERAGQDEPPRGRGPRVRPALVPRRHVRRHGAPTGRPSPSRACCGRFRLRCGFGFGSPRGGLVARGRAGVPARRKGCGVPRGLRASPRPFFWRPSTGSSFSARPPSRRRFLDRLVLGLKPAAGDDLARYGRALRERNALLARSRRTGGAAAPGELEAWTEELAVAGAAVRRQRRAALGALERRIRTSRAARPERPTAGSARSTRRRATRSRSCGQPASGCFPSNAGGGTRSPARTATICSGRGMDARSLREASSGEVAAHRRAGQARGVERRGQSGRGAAPLRR